MKFTWDDGTWYEGERPRENKDRCWWYVGLLVIAAFVWWKYGAWVVFTWFSRNILQVF
jgi:hypothetical protein